MSQSRAMDIGNTGVGENGVNNIKRWKMSGKLQNILVFLKLFVNKLKTVQVEIFSKIFRHQKNAQSFTVKHTSSLIKTRHYLRYDECQQRIQSSFCIVSIFFSQFLKLSDSLSCLELLSIVISWFLPHSGSLSIWCFSAQIRETSTYIWRCQPCISKFSATLLDKKF